MRSATLLATLAVLCLSAPCSSSSSNGDQTATLRKFLDALANVQSALQSAQAVDRANRTTAQGEQARPLHPMVLSYSAKLSGPFGGISTSQTASRLARAIEERDRVDLSGAPAGLLLVPASVEIRLERFSLTGLGSNTAAALGPLRGGPEATSAITVSAAQAVGKQLLHRASRGTLVLDGMILELGGPSTSDNAGGADASDDFLSRRSGDSTSAAAELHLTAAVSVAAAASETAVRHLRGTTAQQQQHAQRPQPQLYQQLPLRDDASGAAFPAVAPSPGGAVHRVQYLCAVVGDGALLVLRNTELRFATVTAATSTSAQAADEEAVAVPEDGAAFLRVGPKDADAREAPAAALNGGRRQRRQLLAAMAAGSELRRTVPGWGWAQVMVVALAVVAAVGGAWLRRLLSCACMGPGPAAQDGPKNIRTQAGSRFVPKGSTPLARNSQNHALFALSRFSAQLRKGDDMSVRDGSRHGSRHGSMIFRAGGGDTSVRGGSHHPPAPAAAATAVELPPLIGELSELKSAGHGRLATSLHGLWQQQHRVVVKVLSHGEDCRFMLEQVGEVWTRLAHANIVTCYAAETFPAAALAAAPDMTRLVPKPADPEAALHTWIVLERCENGSLAAVLAQRHQQQQTAARKAAAFTVDGSGSDAGKEAATARQVAARLARVSRDRQKNRTELKDGGAPLLSTRQPLSLPPPKDEQEEPEVAETSGAAPRPLSPLPASSSLVPALTLPPVKRGADRTSATPSGAAIGAAGGPSTVDSGALGGDDDGGEVATPSPGLLPVAEVLSIAYDVASGLAYLHSLDLCHGDLRAENVMVQTVVLPGAVRQPGGGVEAGAGDPVAAAADDGLTAAVSVAGAVGIPYGGLMAGTAPPAAAEVNSSALALGECHTVIEGLAVMYGSTGGQSDAADGGGGGGAAAGVPMVGTGGGGSVVYQGSTLSNVSMNTCCTAAQESSAHAWSASLRHSNGFMAGSTFASTALQSLPAGGGAGGRCPEPGSSVDDRVMTASPQSQGGLGGTLGSCYFSPSGRHVGQSFALASYTHAKSSTGGGLAAPGAGAVGEGGGAVAAAAATATEGMGLAAPTLTPEAVAALSRAIGVSSSGALQPPPRAATAAAPSGGGGVSSTGGASLIRRQSNGSLSAANTNSGTDMSLMMKALWGLTAWPESPAEGRNVLGPSAAAALASAHGGVSSDCGFCPSPAIVAAGGIGGAADRLGSGTGGGGDGSGVPRRPSLVIGGLRSALAAPSAAKSAAAALPPPLSTNLSSDRPPFATVAAQIPPSDDAVELAAPIITSRLPAEPSGSPGGGASVVVSPRAIAARVCETSRGGGTTPPSPLAAGTAAAAAGSGSGSPGGTAPSTPTGAACSSRTAVGVVCTIAGHQVRRRSAPSAVALPVIRRVAKLTDPWLSLARVPAECAGGPWSPEAAEAVGAVSGADVSHLPPELLLSGQLHPSSDVYSLGILMWRMLSTTGEAPYGKLRPAEVSYKVVACGMRPSFSPAVPDPLRRLVEDCWQSDPAARPTVQQVLQRLQELQSSAAALQTKWRDRSAIFGAVSTVPISAVAVLPLAAEQNEVTARWAEAAGIKLQRTGTGTSGSWAQQLAREAAASSCAASHGAASFGRRSSRGHSSHSFSALATYNTSTGGGGGATAAATGSGSAAHIYQQPPPPTPPAGQITNAQTTTLHPLHFAAAATTSNTIPAAESSNHSNAVSDGHARGSTSSHRPASPYTGHLAVQPYRRGPAGVAAGGDRGMEPF